MKYFVACMSQKEKPQALDYYCRYGRKDQANV